MGPANAVADWMMKEQKFTHPAADPAPVYTVTTMDPGLHACQSGSVNCKHFILAFIYYWVMHGRSQLSTTFLVSTESGVLTWRRCGWSFKTRC